MTEVDIVQSRRKRLPSAMFNCSGRLSKGQDSPRRICYVVSIVVKIITPKPVSSYFPLHSLSFSFVSQINLLTLQR